MKHIHSIPLLAAALALASCQPDSPADLAGGLLLNIENTASAGAKPAVSGITTTWLNDDVISINGAERTVRVIGNVARVTDVTAPNPGEHFFACSPADLFSVPGSNDFWWEYPIGSNQRSLGFTYPREYIYATASDGSQRLASPMVAVAAGDASSLTFRHLAAAVEVHLSNPMNVDILVDSVVVEAAGYSLNGSGYFGLDAEGIPTVSGPAEYGASYARRSVRLTMPDGWTLAAGGNCPLQLPVPPLPDGEQLTVRVHGRTAEALANYSSGDQWMYLVIRNQPSWGDIRDFTFSHSASLAAALERTHLVKARAEIRPDGHLLDSERSIGRLSVFSVSDSKKVLFKKRPVNTWVALSSPYSMPTFAEMHYLMHSRPGARYVRVKYYTEEDHAHRSVMIIFPDGYTIDSVRSLDGMGMLQDGYFNSNTYYDIGSVNTLEIKCERYGFMFLDMLFHNSMEDEEYVYKFSDGYIDPSGGLVSGTYGGEAHPKNLLVRTVING